MIQDLRYGVRTLRKNPGFTAVIVITLALGIGVNTAIFSLVNALLLSPLPYADAERLMQVVHQWQAPGAAQSTAYDTILGPETLAFQRENQVFSNFAYYHDEARSLAGGGEPERIVRRRFRFLAARFGGATHAGTRFFGGRGPAGWFARGNARLWFLAPALRWRPQRSRKNHHA
jgi:hypothetical protein